MQNGEKGSSASNPASHSLAVMSGTSTVMFNASEHFSNDDSDMRVHYIPSSEVPSTMRVKVSD